MARPGASNRGPAERAKFRTMRLSARQQCWKIRLAPENPRHVIHDGSGPPPLPARNRSTLNLMVSENAGTGARLDLLCGHFVVAPPHDRLLRNYFPRRLVVYAGVPKIETVRFGTAAQLSGLVSLMRGEAAIDHLGGRAMLNALSTAMLA